MNLFVQVPIDYRGNSPRFEYRPVTFADLEGLGERVWFCDILGKAFLKYPPDCPPSSRHDICGWRLLIPIPQPASEWT